jgi:hypothetical protein
MTTNQSKYVKLSTTPWTGNGITNPTPSLTLDTSVDDQFSATLSQSNSTLLINGQQINNTAGIKEVLTTLPITSNQSTENVILGTNFADVTSLTGSGGITVTDAAGQCTVTANGVLTIVSAQPEYLNTQVENYVLNIENYSNPATAQVGGSFQFTAVSGAVHAYKCDISSFPAGLYMAEVKVINTTDGAMDCIFLLRKMGGFNYGGGTHEITQTNKMWMIASPNVANPNEVNFFITNEMASPGTTISIDFFRVF